VANVKEIKIMIIKVNFLS